MAKRRADKELTDRNWDDEDEVEEPGEIETASTDAMKGRQILKGRRRGTASGIQNKEFSGFTGFSFKPSSASTPMSSFNVKSFTNGSSNIEDKESDKPSKDIENGQTDSIAASNGSEKKKAAFPPNLKNLNESVLAWIKSHVDKNPYCILTPVFKDYEKHLEEIMKNKESGKSESTDSKSKEDLKETKSSFSASTDVKSTAPIFASTETKSSLTGFSFGSSGSSTTTASATESKPVGSGFAFGASSMAPSFPGFSFKPTPEIAPATSGFSFSVNKPKQDGRASQEEDDEYMPPKAESKEVPEEGSLYSTKCKLFYQHEGKWNEKGVGYLHLKRSDEKLQLVMRADTTLGNILLNIILSTSIPLARQGKNNVSLMCVPNPAIAGLKDDTKPLPMLIRVKTGEDADKLLEKMEEFRKQD